MLYSYSPTPGTRGPHSPSSSRLAKYSPQLLLECFHGPRAYSILPGFWGADRAFFISFPEKTAAGADKTVSPVDDSESWPRPTGLFLKSCEHATCRHLHPLSFPPSSQLDWMAQDWARGSSFRVASYGAGLLGYWTQCWWAGPARRLESGGSTLKLAGSRCWGGRGSSMGRVNLPLLCLTLHLC